MVNRSQEAVKTIITIRYTDKKEAALMWDGLLFLKSKKERRETHEKDHSYKRRVVRVNVLRV